jgi:hypothetical protein
MLWAWCFASVGGSVIYDFPRFAAQLVPHQLMSAALRIWRAASSTCAWVGAGGGCGCSRREKVRALRAAPRRRRQRSKRRCRSPTPSAPTTSRR